MSDHDTWNMFAAAALQGLIAYAGVDPDRPAAVRAANLADALLAESKKRETPALPTSPQPDPVRVRLAAALKDAMRSTRKDFRSGPAGDRQHQEAYAEQFAALSEAGAMK